MQMCWEMLCVCVCYLGDDHGQTVHLELPPGAAVVHDLLHRPPDDQPHPLDRGNGPGRREAGVRTTKTLRIGKFLCTHIILL